jgi:hypothetical protein
MRKASRPNGVILYRGPSQLNGEPIVVIATGLDVPSSNEKTGDMVQTYVLADVGQEPQDAIKSGADASICGDCPHRAQYDASGAYVKAGSCYVNAGQGARQVYLSFLKGNYPVYNAQAHKRLLAGRLIRFGTYGDPAAVPSRVWRRLARLARGRTGYTHQWRRAAPQARAYLMASVDTPEEAAQAQAQGWRTFRVRKADEPVLASEIICPASAEAGQRRTCETCKACSGATASAAARSVVIIVHGLAWKVARFEETRARIEAGRRVALSLV